MQEKDIRHAFWGSRRRGAAYSLTSSTLVLMDEVTVVTRYGKSGTAITAHVQATTLQHRTLGKKQRS